MRGYYHTGCPSIAPTASPIFFISQPAPTCQLSKRAIWDWPQLFCESSFAG
jgi:hypothetical protein